MIKMTLVVDAGNAKLDFEGEYEILGMKVGGNYSIGGNIDEVIIKMTDYIQLLHGKAKNDIDGFCQFLAVYGIGKDAAMKLYSALK